MCHRRGPQRLVDVIGARISGVNDVALARNADHRRRQIDEIAADPRRAAITVVDDDNFASIRRAPVAAQQAAALVSLSIKARAVWPLEHRHCIGAAPLDTHVPCLPTETISFAVADDGAPALADDHAAGLLNHDPIALAHFPASAAHVIESARIVLGRWGHKLALRLRRGGAGRWGRRLQRGRSDGGRSDRRLRRRGTRRLADRTTDATLIRLLRAWRRCRRLRARRGWRLHLTFLRTARRLRAR